MRAWTANRDWQPTRGGATPGSWEHGHRVAHRQESGSRRVKWKELHEMRSVMSLVVAVLASVVLVVPAVALADGRVALGWATAPTRTSGGCRTRTTMPGFMSAALRRLGFEVTTEFDADRVELTEALRTFTRQSAGRPASDRCPGTVAGVERNDREAIGWSRRSADRGNSCGQAYLGRMDVRERSGRAADRVEAVRWHRRVAEQGDSRAQESRNCHHAGPIIHASSYSSCRVDCVSWWVTRS